MSLFTPRVGFRGEIDPSPGARVVGKGGFYLSTPMNIGLEALLVPTFARLEAEPRPRRLTVAEDIRRNELLGLVIEELARVKTELAKGRDKLKFMSREGRPKVDPLVKDLRERIMGAGRDVPRGFSTSSLSPLMDEGIKALKELRARER